MAARSDQRLLDADLRMSEQAPLPGSEASKPADGAEGGDTCVDQDAQAVQPSGSTPVQVGTDIPDESMPAGMDSQT
eukprot:12425699-Karenia_brevis.AAC.1